MESEQEGSYIEQQQEDQHQYEQEDEEQQEEQEEEEENQQIQNQEVREVHQEEQKQTQKQLTQKQKHEQKGAEFQSPFKNEGLEVQYESPDTYGRTTAGTDGYLTQENASPATNKKQQRLNIEQQEILSSTSKVSKAQSHVEKNLQVKTKEELRQEYKAKKNQMLDEIMQKPQPVWAKVNRSQLKAYQQRADDWQKLQLRNKRLDKFIPSEFATKNTSQAFITNHADPSHDELVKSGICDNNLGGTFCQSKKEKAYHLSNSSQVNMQPSFHSSELPEKDEFTEFPATKGNKEMAIQMRKSSIMPESNKSNYIDDKQFPEGYSACAPKEYGVHNFNNQQVQTMRYKTSYNSNVF